MKKNTLHFGMTAKAVMIGQLLGVAGKMYAYDFSAVCATGQRLYYNIIDATNHYVELTYPGSSIYNPWTNATKPTGNIILPSQVEHDGLVFSVRSISSAAFKGCSGLVGDLVIPNTVQEIGGQFHDFGAFHGCSGFNGTLSLGNSVTTIGYGAFSGCSGFTGNLIIPNSVITIGDNAFYHCSGFNGTLTLGNSVTTLGYGAFFGCSGFTGNLVIPNSVTSIGGAYDGTFQGCSGFNGTLTLGNSVTTIGYGAFSGCSGFTGNLTLPNSIMVIGSYAFYNCSGFTGGLTIGNSVTTIGYGTFQNCSGLTGSLTIPNTVTYLEGLAFQNCSGFSGILTIPSSVDSIGYNVFYGCDFAEVHYNALHAEYTYGWTGDTPHNFDNCSGSLVIGDNVESIPAKMFCNSGFTGSITIGSSVTSIGRFAFANCNSVSEVHFNPTNCIQCGYEETAFSGCAGSLIIGDNVTQIPSNAFIFAGFNGTLTIGNSVTTLGEAAFNSCGGFTGGLVIPNSVTEIGAWAFAGAGFDGELIIPNTITTIDGGVFSGCGFTGELVIPNSVTTIEVSAFEGCSGFTGNLIIPNTLNTIHQFAFAGCSGFNGCLEIPNSVTHIESMAFYGCSGISCISIPNTVQSIGGNVFTETSWYNAQTDGILYYEDWCLGYKGSQPTGNLNIQEGTKGIAGWAFDHCYNLTGVLTIPESIERIGEMAFVGCSGLTELHYDAISLDFGFMDSPFVECYGLNTLVIGDNVEMIPWGIFRELGFTGDLTIPNSVISIGESAFESCSSLSGNLIIGNSVTSIGSYAFYNCSGMDSLIIGNSVSHIGNYAFYNCSGINSMTVFAVTPPTLGSGYKGTIKVFSNVDKSIPVYVPYGTVAAYQAALGWNEFTNYQEMPPMNTTQTVELAAGWNWFSINVEITLDDLKTALMDAVPGTNITIKSRTQNIAYNPGTNQWRGTLDSLDVTQMYMISVSADCEISLTGLPINPAEHPVTIHNGINWMAFPLSENMSVSNAFAGFAMDGDIIKSRTNNASYNNGEWRGNLNTLVPGQGYMYKSNATESRTFNYPSAK